MREGPMISVIIPVYNVEPYIEKCMDSVRMQTYQNLDVILVDDGSKDRTKAIIEGYIKKYALDRFRLISKPNGGVSSARNCGIRQAKGEWISFLDGDDWLEKDCFLELTNTLQKYPCDLVYGGYQACDQETGNTEVWSRYDREYGRFPEDIEGLNSFSFSFARLYKKSIIDEYHIVFDETIRYCEDNAWQFSYNRWIRSYACTNAVVYNYRINRPGALTGGLVAPGQKRNLWKHADEFCRCLGDRQLTKGIEGNLSLTRVLWNAVITEISVLVIDGHYAKAKSLRKTDLTGKVVNNYKPRSRKEKVFLGLLKGPFPVLYLFVSFYYGNFEKLRKSKLLRTISKSK